MKLRGDECDAGLTVDFGSRIWTGIQTLSILFALSG